MPEIVRIKDLGTVVTGSTPPTSAPENFSRGYPFIRPPILTRIFVGFSLLKKRFQKRVIMYRQTCWFRRIRHV